MSEQEPTPQVEPTEVDPDEFGDDNEEVEEERESPRGENRRADTE